MAGSGVKQSQRVAGAVAAFAAGALVVGVVNTGGVSAVFSDSASAAASIQVGDFGCEFSTSVHGVSFTDRGDGTVTASFELPKIMSSEAGSATVPVTVKNTGEMPVTVSWQVGAIGTSVVEPTKDVLTGKFTPVDPSALLGLAPGGNIFLPATEASKDLQIGLNWSELDKHDRDTAGTVTYTSTCTDALPEPAGLTFRTYAGGVAYWDGTQVVLVTPGGAGSNGYAIVRLPDVGTSLPEDPPVFVTSSGYDTRPAMELFFTDGHGASQSISQYPELHNSIRWEQQGGWSTADWDVVKSYTAGWTLNYVEIQNLDTGAAHGVVAPITCINFTGTPIFGSC